MRAHRIHTQFSRLALRIAPGGALRREVIAAVDDGHLIERRVPVGVHRAEECVQRERCRAIAAREAFDERLDPWRIDWTGHSGFAGAAGRGVAGIGVGIGAGVLPGGGVRGGGAPAGVPTGRDTFRAESGSR